MSDFIMSVKNGETLAITFDFSKELANPWQSDYQYTTNEFITIGALVYECTNAGKTGYQIPENLTTTIGGTQADGTVEWTCRDWSTSGSDTISTKTVTADTGITIDSSTITKSLYVDVIFTATTTGKKDITCDIDTVAGETILSVLGVVVK